MTKTTTESTFKRTMGLMGNRLPLFLTAALTTSVVIGYGFNMVLAFIARNVMDASMSNDQSLLVRALILAAVTFFAGMPIWLGAQYLTAVLTKKSMNGFRVRLFGHIIKLPAGSFAKHHSGDLVSRCTNDIGVIEGIFTSLIPGLFVGFVLGVIGMILIFGLDWRFGLIALAIGLITMLLTLKMAPPIRKASEAVQAALGKQTERLTDLLQGLQVSKMFQLEETIHQQYRTANQAWAHAHVKHGSLQTLFMMLSAVMDMVKSVGTLVFGLYLLTLGDGTLGTIVAAIHLQGNAGFLFSNLGNFTAGIQQSLAGSQRVFELLDEPVESVARPAPTSDAILSNDAILQLQAVTFRYEDDEESEQVLNNVNMTLQKGQLIALVGPSGGGKSTLIKLLMGLYAPTQGTVFLQGKSLLQYPLEELRDQIAYVPQDAYLFDGTIEENIRFGNPQATQEAVIAAAQAAYAHDFILQQPEGYQTMVGEHGAHLSGGQRQRIAIARALLKDAPILLLDEATSALDSESEQLVQKALEALMEGRTTIAVAHRLSTIQNADQIFVIKDGCIVEQGSHAELLQHGGVYQQLHAIQFSNGG